MNSTPFGDEKLQFPLECHFKVIVSGEAEVMKTKIEVSLKAIEIKVPVHEGNRSESGKYITFNLSVEVISAAQMKQIDGVLRSIEGVKMVL